MYDLQLAQLCLTKRGSRDISRVVTRCVLVLVGRTVNLFFFLSVLTAVTLRRVTWLSYPLLKMVKPVTFSLSAVLRLAVVVTISSCFLDPSCITVNYLWFVYIFHFSSNLSIFSISQVVALWAIWTERN